MIAVSSDDSESEYIHLGLEWPAPESALYGSRDARVFLHWGESGVARLPRLCALSPGSAEAGNSINILTTVPTLVSFGETPLDDNEKERFWRTASSERCVARELHKSQPSENVGRQSLPPAVARYPRASHRRAAHVASGVSRPSLTAAFPCCA
jgi:hypothetical protein